jgi:predicted metallo-beta-lactamase superfamily hydrolase
MEFIFKQKPEIIIVDGPSTYIDSPTASIELKKAITYLSRLIEESNTTKIVIDHHSARDINYKDRLKKVFEEGRKAGVWVGLAAELLDMKPNLLEARRKELYEKYET